MIPFGLVFFQGLPPARHVGLERAADLVADASEHGQALLLGAGRMGGVIERPVVPVHLARKDRAGLVRDAADRDHGLDRGVHELRHRLRAMAGDINADLLHHLNSERVNVTRRIRSGALHVERIAGGRAQDAFGEMAATRVAGAEDENGGFHF